MIFKFTPRSGGDSFTVHITNPNDRADARRAYRRMREAGVPREQARTVWHTMFHIGVRAGFRWMR